MLLTLLNAALLSASSSRVNFDLNAFLDRLINWSIDAGKNIIGAILIYIIGRFIIKQINAMSQLMSNNILKIFFFQIALFIINSKY